LYQNTKSRRQRSSKAAKFVSCDRKTSLKTITRLNPLSEPNPKAAATQEQGILFFDEISPNGEFVFEIVGN
jgi:hypothetical protein